MSKTFTVLENANINYFSYTYEIIKSNTFKHFNSPKKRRKFLMERNYLVS